MSSIIGENWRENGVRSIVNHRSGKAYCVDTADTFDCGWETMVFRYNLRRGCCLNANDLYVRHYTDREEAMEGHKEVSLNLEEFL